VHRNVMVLRVPGSGVLAKQLPDTSIRCAEADHPQRCPLLDPTVGCPPLISPTGSSCRPPGPTGLVRLGPARGAPICMGNRKNRLTATKRRNRFCIILATGTYYILLDELITTVRSFFACDACGGR
jgi:hypothetical protein